MHRAKSPLLRMSTLAVFTTLVVACGGEGGPNVDGGADAGPTSVATLEVLYGHMYSGYDGVHDYKIGVIVAGIQGAKFTASDPGYVDIAETLEGATLTMKKPGEVTILAEKDEMTGHAKLTISAYTPAQWELGNVRYNEGAAWMRETASFDGGVLVVDPETRCVDCHGDDSEPRIRHTPLQTGGYTDAELADVFLRGTLPARRSFPYQGISEEEWSVLHRWTMTLKEEAGLLAYLRSLPSSSEDLFQEGNPFAEPLKLGGPSPCPADQSYICRPASGPEPEVCVEPQSMQPPECKTYDDCAAVGLKGDCVNFLTDLSLCIQLCDAD